MSVLSYASFSNVELDAHLSQALDGVERAGTSTNDHNPSTSGLCTTSKKLRWTGHIRLECILLIGRDINLAIRNMGFEGMKRGGRRRVLLIGMT